MSCSPARYLYVYCFASSPTISSASLGRRGRLLPVHRNCRVPHHPGVLGVGSLAGPCAKWSVGRWSKLPSERTHAHTSHFSLFLFRSQPSLTRARAHVCSLTLLKSPKVSFFSSRQKENSSMDKKIEQSIELPSARRRAEVNETDERLVTWWLLRLSLNQ